MLDTFDSDVFGPYSSETNNNRGAGNNRNTRYEIRQRNRKTRAANKKKKRENSYFFFPVRFGEYCSVQRYRKRIENVGGVRLVRVNDEYRRLQFVRSA